MDALVDSLSILIVTWNGDELLANCLDSVARVYSTHPEIIVVDNAAAPSTRELVGKYPNAKYLSTKENLGFAGGNNLGFVATTRKYVLLLNNDTIIHEDSFSPLLRFLAANAKVGIVQGTMNTPARNNGLDVCGEDLWPWGLLHHRLIGKPTASTKLKAKRVFAAKGAMLMMKREVVDSLDGELFDGSFRNYFEDIDFCFRARKRGWQTWFIPTPPIDHLCAQTSGRFDQRDIMERYFRNILKSFHRNFGFWGHLFTIPCFLLAMFVRSPRIFFRIIIKPRQG